jgi:hypothetical protein
MEFINEKDCNIIQNIKKLPDSISLKIYKEFLEPEIYYLIYNEMINNYESKKLNIILVKPYVTIFLSKPLVLNYLLHKCNAFKNSYNDHKVKKIKNFKNLNNGDSFALSILFYLYH